MAGPVTEKEDGQTAIPSISRTYEICCGLKLCSDSPIGTSDIVHEAHGWRFRHADSSSAFSTQKKMRCIDKLSGRRNLRSEQHNIDKKHRPHSIFFAIITLPSTLSYDDNNMAWQKPNEWQCLWNWSTTNSFIGSNTEAMLCRNLTGSLFILIQLTGRSKNVCISWAKLLMVSGSKEWNQSAATPFRVLEKEALNILGCALSPSIKWHGSMGGSVGQSCRHKQ